MAYHPDHFTVWAEIPVTDLDKAIAFYNAVTDAGLTITTDMGPNPMAIFRPRDPSVGVALNLYPGRPAGDGRGPTLHIAAPGKVEDTLQRVSEAGGTVVSDVIEIPEGRFAYTTDPDGNSVAFFESA